MSNNNRLRLAKELVIALEQGDEETSDQLLDDMAGMRESQLFKEVGKLTRQLHDAMGSFVLDARITALTEHDIPDAKVRLNYVISMTEQAANQTLTVVEELLQVTRNFDAQAALLSSQWERFLARDMSYEEFKAMSQALSAYFQSLTDMLHNTQSGLNTILMAQGFQDITGQIIRKVIDLVKSLEESMVGLIRVSGSKKIIENDEMPGPVVPGLDDTRGDVANDQDDVDDLLSSLGF